MFEKILIANRGEVAVRVIRACKEMGVKTVAVYSTADADSYHVQIADEAWCIGGPRPADSYLNMDALLTVAVESGATAIHPGYGFLSESAEFARRCRECGLVFIGPSPEVIERMGDKDEARRTAKAAGVPIVEGSDLLSDADEAEQMAKRIGFPLLIKARAGGGGRGIRKIESIEGVRSAFQEASSEAASAFGDGGCYMERFISPAHHVEVQVLGDAAGNVVSVGERECSVQRRNQKLLEESPSPSITPEVRAHMCYFLFDEDFHLVGWKNIKTNEQKISRVGDTYLPFAFNGIHVVDPAIFQLMEGFEGKFSIVDLYLQLAKTQNICGYDVTQNTIIDVGKPASLLEAEKRLL